MKKPYLAGVAVILAVSLSLAGCGGGDDDESPADQPAVMEAEVEQQMVGDAEMLDGVEPSAGPPAAAETEAEQQMVGDGDADTPDGDMMAGAEVGATTRPEIDLAPYLTGPVEQGEAPGLIAAVIDAQGVVRGAGAAGVRRQGSPEALTVNDLFHVASCGKPMTATMLAVLIDQAVFPNDWDTTIADVFPELGDVMQPAYHDVTLYELLRMTGGVVGEADADWDAIGTDYQDEPDIIASRYALVRDTLQLQPAGPTGEWEYSSLGYVVAGAMAERLTGESWETLMETHLLDPLGMTTAGFAFDWPDTPEAAEWGHVLDGGTWTPLDLAVHLPHAELIGPAGGVHLSMDDWGKFIALWFPGREPAILDRATLDGDLLETVLGFYAAGWSVGDFSYAGEQWTGGPVIRVYGAGGPSGFSATVRILPDHGIAYAAFANASTAFEPVTFANDTFILLDTVIAQLHDAADVQGIIDGSGEDG